MLKRVAELYGVSSDYLLELTEPTPQLFDDSRVERPEILEIYDELPPHQQKNLLNFARGMMTSYQLERATVESAGNNRRSKLDENY